MSRRIGLLGGTFDPVHIGHLSIAESFINSSFIDELWILLTPYPPHKRKKGHVAYNLRLKMVEATFGSIENCTILTIENELPKPSFTYRTIQHLKELHPYNEYYFCMGEDSLARFHTWKYHEKILEEANLLVAERPGATHSDVKIYILDQTTFVEHEPVAISSSELKQMIVRNENYEPYVPEEVKHIIKTEDLYREIQD